jgi:hypothetical protein
MNSNVIKFIELQNAINNQINTYGVAEDQLADELEFVGQSLSGDEMNELISYYEADANAMYDGDEMEYEDIEYQIVN